MERTTWSGSISWYRAKLGIDLFRNEPNPAQGTRNKFGDELFILYRRRKNGDFPRVVGRKIGDTVEFVSSKYRSDIGDSPPCFDRRVSTGKCLYLLCPPGKPRLSFRKRECLSGSRMKLFKLGAFN